MKALLEYLILGFIQGITEPIPVSSSGHLLIFQTLLEKFNQSINIDYSILSLMTNMGSFIAIFIFFRKEIFKLIGSFFKYIFKKKTRVKTKCDFKYCMYIILATIPAGIMGVVVSKLGLFDFLEENVKFVGLMLVVTSFFLYLIKDFNGSKEKEDITLKDAIVIGFTQVLALIPGISRSGSTIVGGMFRGLSRETAFNFSFILYLPISVGTSILGIKDLLEASLSTKVLIYYCLATLVAGIFTYLGTMLFSKMVRKGKLLYFTIYCLLVGLAVIFFL